MSTIKDVANKANVSIATASRALRQIGYVSDEILKRVTAAAEELDYIADSSAQQLRNQKNKTIGFIISNVNNIFYNKMLASLEIALKSRGYDILVSYSAEDTKKECDSFRTMIGAKVKAIVFIPVTNENHKIIHSALSRDIDVIQIFRRIYSDIATIVIDDEYSTYEAAKHLVENGSKRPMLINVGYVSMNNFDVRPDRSYGFSRAMQECKITDYSMYRHNILTKDSDLLFDAIKQFAPDAIIASNSSFGIDVLNCLNKLGQSVPKDVKLVVFDDMDWIDYLKLSSIKQDITKLTEAILTRLFDNSFVIDQISVKSSLIIRASSLKAIRLKRRI